MAWSETVIRDAEWLEDIFESQVEEIHRKAQSVDSEDLSFDPQQAVEAMGIADRILERLSSNPTTRTLSYEVLAATSHMFGVMAARPLSSRHASVSHVDYVNAYFAVSSAFARLKVGGLAKLDFLILFRLLRSFQDRPTWREPFERNLGSDLERDLSAILFFFEAYIRRGIWTTFKFRNPKRWARFRR